MPNKVFLRVSANHSSNKYPFLKDTETLIVEKLNEFLDGDHEFHGSLGRIIQGGPSMSTTRLKLRKIVELNRLIRMRTQSGDNGTRVEVTLTVPEDLDIRAVYAGLMKATEPDNYETLISSKGFEHLREKAPALPKSHVTRVSAVPPAALPIRGLNAKQFDPLVRHPDLVECFLGLLRTKGITTENTVSRADFAECCQEAFGEVFESSSSLGMIRVVTGTLSCGEDNDDCVLRAIRYDSGAIKAFLLGRKGAAILADFDNRGKSAAEIKSAPLVSRIQALVAAKEAGENADQRCVEIGNTIDTIQAENDQRKADIARLEEEWEAALELGKELLAELRNLPAVVAAGQAAAAKLEKIAAELAD